MMRVLALVILQLYIVEGFFPRRPTANNLKSDGGDPGEPLFLTPYIEAGKIDEARRLARVTLPDLPDIESYSGFFTVNKTYNSNQFLWYFPAFDKKFTPSTLLWLQGGPGQSSLNGLFLENGPFSAEIINNTLQFRLRKHHWAQYQHIIYIDNPVGAGFSFTNDSRGYCTDQTQIGEQLYNTLIQFYQLFPELQVQNLSITGESYAGKYIPALGRTIHAKNPTAKIKINLSGMFIGSGWYDPINQLGYHKHIEQLGLFFPRYMTEQFKIVEWAIKYSIKQKDWLTAYNQYIFLQEQMSLASLGLSKYNFMNDSHSTDTDINFKKLITTSLNRKAIHVGDITYEGGAESAFTNLKEDFMKSVTPWIIELLSHYNIVFYNGQLDVYTPYQMTLNSLEKLDYPHHKAYLAATRWALFGVENDSGRIYFGFGKCAGKMGEILIRSAGHFLARDQPLPAKLLMVFLTFDFDYIPFCRTNQDSNFNETLFEQKMPNNDLIVVRKI